MQINNKSELKSVKDLPVLAYTLHKFLRGFDCSTWLYFFKVGDNVPWNMHEDNYVHRIPG
jgi:hypothetical protein